MALGYEVQETEREFEIKKVTRYAVTSMEFPCYVINLTDEKPLKAYMLNVLKSMFVKSDVYDESISKSMIHLYFSQSGKTVKYGVIQASQVKTFLKLFADNDVDGYLDADTPLSGSMLYALSM